MSEDFSVVISLRGFFVHVCYVILNQGYCGTCQYSLPDTMLWHDFNKTLNQSYVILTTLVDITYQSMRSVSPIYPFLGQWYMKAITCPTVFWYQFLISPISVCDVNNKNNFQACFCFIFVLFCFVFIPGCAVPSITDHCYCYYRYCY